MSEGLLLEAQDIHKAYNQGQKELQVLKGIDLKIKTGQIVAIVGPSGAGKSTLLHILGGLDKPSKGKVFFDKLELYSVSDEERARLRNMRIGFVFQFYHLFSELNALENILLPAFIKTQMSMNKDLYDKGTQLLKMVGLEKRFNHRPNQLSGGEQQRLAIARALVNSPDMVFCDEPTGNLDSKTAEGILDLLWQLNINKKMTLLIVTHDENIAKKSHSIIHIQDGRLSEDVTYGAL